MTRCAWVRKDNPLYITYHDEEWGTPVTNDKTLFEFMVLEGAQAGLSWETILNKREGYRKAFKNFDPKKVARMTEKDRENLRSNPAIVRNKLKIQSVVTNAEAFLRVQKEFGSFATYLWSWVDNAPIQNSWKNISEVPAVTDLAKELSKDLKKRGFSFLGPTIMYAYMQAVGMVNDHTTDCFRYKEVQKPSAKIST